MAEPLLFRDASVYWTTATGSTTFTEIPDVKSVEIPFSKAELANSVMSDGAETFFPGLISAPITITCRQSFESGGADAAFWTRWNSETKFKLRIRPSDTGTAGTTNPQYVFSRVSVFAITPISGAHGVLLENAAQLRMLSGSTLTRSTDS